MNALLTMWMVSPNQAAGLQGFPFIRRGALGVKNLGIGSGWQQSRKNWVPAAVVGQGIRIGSRGLYNVEAASLYSVFLPCLGNSGSSRDLAWQSVLHSKGKAPATLQMIDCPSGILPPFTATLQMIDYPSGFLPPFIATDQVIDYPPGVLPPIGDSSQSPQQCWRIDLFLKPPTVIAV